MVTRVTQSKIPSNPRVSHKPAKDTVSPSVRGLKTIIPSTVGIAENARYRFKKVGRDAAIIVDALKIVHAAHRSGDAALIASAKPLVPMVRKALDKLGRSVDSLARETAAVSKKDKPEAQTPSALIDPPALVEGDPKTAAGLIGDQAFTNYTPDALERREARTNLEAKLGYALERGDTLEAHRICYGLNPREDQDPYAAMGHKGE